MRRVTRSRIGDIAFDAAQALARDLSADGSSAFALNLDVTAKAASKRRATRCSSAGARIDALVNNAGASKVVPVMEITAEQFDQVINVNLRSVLFGCQVFGQHFADRGRGTHRQHRVARGTERRLGDRRALRGRERRRDHAHQGIRARSRRGMA